MIKALFKNKLLALTSNIFLLIYIFFNNSFVRSEDKKINLNNAPDVNYLEKEIENDYIIGPGDVLQIKPSRQILTDQLCS